MGLPYSLLFQLRTTLVGLWQSLCAATADLEQRAGQPALPGADSASGVEGGSGTAVTAAHESTCFRPVALTELTAAVARLSTGTSLPALAQTECEVAAYFGAPSFAALGHGPSLLSAMAGCGAVAGAVAGCGAAGNAAGWGLGGGVEVGRVMQLVEHVLRAHNADVAGML